MWNSIFRDVPTRSNSVDDEAMWAQLHSFVCSAWPGEFEELLLSEAWPPSWQLNIVVSPSVPMRATSAASSVATCTDIPLHLTNPSDCMSSEGSLSRHILLMRTSASAETLAIESQRPSGH